MGSRLRHATSLTTLLCALVSAPASGQGFDDTQQDSSDEAPPSHYFTFSAGVSQFVGDIGEGNFSSVGPTLRLGLQLPSSSAAISLSRWPEVGDFTLTALHLEISQDLASRRRLTPVLVAAVGHTWGHYAGTIGIADEPDGTSGAFGLGLDAAIASRFSLTTDARLRTDDGGWNLEWRAMTQVATSTSRIPTAESRRTNAVGSWLTTLGGPWVSVEPAFGMQVVQGRDLLTIQMAHWRIPDNSGLGGYGWDTRAVIASAQTERGIVGDALRWRIGPAVAAMGEGPDSGISFGSQIDLVVGFEIRDLRMETTAGWLWLKRVHSDEAIQHGLSWGLALGL